MKEKDREGAFVALGGGAARWPPIWYYVITLSRKEKQKIMNYEIKMIEGSL